MSCSFGPTFLPGRFLKGSWSRPSGLTESRVASSTETGPLLGLSSPGSRLLEEVARGAGTAGFAADYPDCHH